MNNIDIQQMILGDMGREIAHAVDRELTHDFLFYEWYRNSGLPNPHPLREILKHYSSGFSLYIASDKKNHKVKFYKLPYISKKEFKYSDFIGLNDVIRNRSGRSYVSWWDSTFHVSWSDKERILLELMEPQQRNQRMMHLLSWVSDDVRMDNVGAHD